MAQYLIHPKHPLRTIAYVVLAVGLVIGGFFTFKASQTSTEGRSKAALEKNLVADWNFDENEQNWIGDKGTAKQMVDKRSLKTIIEIAGDTASASSGVSLSDQNFIYGTGNKEIKISIAIEPGKHNNIKGCCSFELYTTKKPGSPDNEKKLTQNISFSVKDDGLQHNYLLKVPAIGNLYIKKARISLKGLGKEDRASIDYIRFILNTKPTPTPTPLDASPTPSE